MGDNALRASMAVWCRTNCRCFSHEGVAANYLTDSATLLAAAR